MKRNALILASFGIFSLACNGGTDTGVDSDTNTSTQADYVGLSFLLESADGYTPLADVDVRLWISESSSGGLMLRVAPGCNSGEADFTVDDAGVLTVDGIGMAEMACDKASMAQDYWFVDFIMSEPVLSYTAPRLTLTGDEATLVFLDTEVATPDLDLEGTEWTIDGFIDGEAYTNFNLSDLPTLSLDAAGTLDFFDACNVGTGSYELDGNVLILSEFTTSYRECKDEVIIEVSNHFLSVISEGETTVEIDANRITLMRGSMGLSGTGE